MNLLPKVCWFGPHNIESLLFLTPLMDQGDLLMLVPSCSLYLCSTGWLLRLPFPAVLPAVMPLVVSAAATSLSAILAG